MDDVHFKVNFFRFLSFFCYKIISKKGIMHQGIRSVAIGSRSAAGDAPCRCMHKCETPYRIRKKKSQ